MRTKGSFVCLKTVIIGENAVESVISRRVGGNEQNTTKVDYAVSYECYRQG